MIRVPTEAELEAMRRAYEEFYRRYRPDGFPSREVFYQGYWSALKDRSSA